MIKMITDIHDGEPDILTPVKHEMLLIKDLDGFLLATSIAPKGGWTHSQLDEQAKNLESLTKDGADAYLGGQWVGSTEV